MRILTTSVAALLFVALLASDACVARGNGTTYGDDVSDTTATIVAPSPPASSVTLTGILRRGYMVYRHGVFVHGQTEQKQQYYFLHLARPIDVRAPIDSPPHYGVSHQYDIQVVGPLPYSKIIDRCVTIIGTMPAPGGVEGGPDWQPFPLTISANSARTIPSSKCSVGAR